MSSEMAFLSDLNLGNRETLFRTLFTANLDGVALLSGDERFLDMNPAFATMFGLRIEDVLPVQWAELFRQPFADEYPQAVASQSVSLREMLAGQEVLAYTEREFFVRGCSYVLGCQITHLLLDAKRYFLVFVRDVTGIREHIRSNASFLSTAAHELRSPLNALNGYLDLVLSGIGGELNEQQQEFIQRARSGSEHLYALLENLVVISRIDSRQMRLKREVVQLAEIIENAVEEFDLTATDYGIKVQVEIAGEIQHLYADAVRVQQVLRNLISNALNYTSAGGRVEISAFVITRPVATVIPASADPFASSCQGGEIDERTQRIVCVQVHDSGCGIASAYHKRIFERFYQVSDATIQHAGGLGLGLAVVKEIMEAHGGSVQVESIPEGGSTFTCLFPDRLF